MRRAGLTWNGDPRVKPPYGAAEIDWGHPLASGLVLATWSTERAGSAFDFGLGRRGTFTDPLWSSGVITGPDIANAGSRYVTVSAPQLAIGSIWTRYFVRTLPATSHIYGLFSWVNSADAEPNVTYDKVITLYPESGGQVDTRYYVYDGASKSFRGSNIGAWSAALNRVGSWGMTFDGGTLRGYRDGMSDGSLAAGSTYVGYTTPAVRIGARVNSFDGSGIATERFDGVQDTFLAWSCILPADAFLQLHAEPYAMLRPRVSRRYFVPAAAGGMLPYTPLRRRQRRRLLT